MELFYKVIDGFRVKFCTFYFCVGIGMDQLTPAYARVTLRHKLGLDYSNKSLFCNNVKKGMEQTKSLSSSNYGKRARHK